jgi:hypothetical protein
MWHLFRNAFPNLVAMICEAFRSSSSPFSVNLFQVKITNLLTELLFHTFGTRIIAARSSMVVSSMADQHISFLVTFTSFKDDQNMNPHQISFVHAESTRKTMLRLVQDVVRGEQDVRIPVPNFDHM